MKDLLSVFFAFLIVLALVILPVYGYINNIIQFLSCDFKAPYKAEVIRGAGVFMAPVGAIAGLFEIDD